MHTYSQQDISIDKLVAHIQTAGLVIMPTETSYGIIADATSKDAVANVYDLKQRDAGKPLPVVCGSRDQVEEFFIIDPVFESFITKYWPGPLTCVLQPKDDRVKANPGHVFADTVAVRVTSHPLLQKLCLVAGKPLVATSANPSGDDAVYDFNEITFADDACIAIDGGMLPSTPASTIITHGVDGIEVVRKGPIVIE